MRGENVPREGKRPFLHYSLHEMLNCETRLIWHLGMGYTVKRVDEVVRHPHLVTQDQNTQVSNKVSDIPEENFTINIELFRQTFTNVELLR